MSLPGLHPVAMGDDSDEEAELRAALAAFGANGGGSNSDSDDDGISEVDTSAVARILAARQSSDFGALADALQTAAVAAGPDAEDAALSDELQVTNARVCAHCSLRRSLVCEEHQGC